MSSFRSIVDPKLQRKAFTEMCDEALPGFNEWITPRRYLPPAQYWTTKLMDEIQANDVFAFLTVKEDERPSDYSYRMRLRLGSFRVPTYFISKEMTWALLRTSPPYDIPLSEFRLPYDGLRFVFEKGAYVLADGSELACFDTAHLPKGTSLAVPDEVKKAFAYRSVPARGIGQMESAIVENGEFIFEALRVTPGTNRYGFQSFRRQTDVNITTIGQVISPDVIAQLNEIYRERNTAMRGVMAPGETYMFGALASFYINAVMILVNKPEYVEGGELARGYKAKGARVKGALYHPRYIGRKFAFPGSGLGGGTGSQSTGKHTDEWRAGHWKDVAHGPRHSLRRHQWILPYQIHLGELKD